MSFRSVVISSQARLSYKNRYLVVKNGLEEKYVHLSEIDTLIIDNISTTISTYLLKELSDSKINVIFCDEKHNPFGEVSSLYNSHNTSKKIYKQIKWNKKAKEELWSKIVRNKIINQSLLLHKIKSENYELLLEYIKEIQIDDKTNREGHAAKVYFNSLFGKKFTRDDNNSINAALNYGYAILLSTFNKEIVSLGYLTELGIHHKNEFNPFNLTCDLMEPFRIVIDNFVYFNQTRDFDNSYKMDLVNLFNDNFKYNNKNYTLKEIIKMYTKNVIDCLEENNNYKEFVI